MKNLALVLLLIPFAAFLFSCGKTESNTKVTEKITNESAGKKPEGSKEIKIDVNSSEVLWHGAKVTGEHHGDVKIKQGVLYLKDGKIAGGTVDIDLATIKDKDITDEGSKAKLENHLKSEDFFDVAKFPTAKLEIIEVTPIQNSVSGQANHTVKGNLTIKGVSKGITFPAVLNISESKVTGNAVFDIDRTEFGLKYGSGKFFEGLGDKMIKDNFTMKFNITTN